MSKNLFLILPFFASVFSAPAIIGCATGGTPQASETKEAVVPLAGNFVAHRFILNNGLRILVVEDHSSPTFAYQTWFKVGSRNEIPGHTGLAHLFEHMMFKGTKNFKDGEFSRILDTVGAEGENAFTSRDYTAYVQELPKRKGDAKQEGTLDLIAHMESERMVNLIVDEKVFKTETEVVQNERRFRYENNADGMIYQEMYDVGFTKHPYRWPVIGYQKDLEAMSVKDAVDFYRSYYNPNHATVVVVGDVTPSEVLDTVQKYYGSLPSQPAPPSNYSQEPPQESPRRKQLKLGIQVEKLSLNYHVPGSLSDDMPALNLIGAVLTTGKSSRLHRALVETGIAAGVDTYDPENVDPSLFSVMVNFQKGKKATQGESIILRELSLLTHSLVPESELEKAKNKITFNFFQELEGNSRKAHFLGHYETVADDFTKGVALMDKVRKVTPEEVQTIARKYFNPNTRIVITGVPK